MSTVGERHKSPRKKAGDRMEDTDNSSAKQTWTHRNIHCRLHHVDSPKGDRWIGYARFGDRWVEIVDRTDVREERAIELVEREVDRKIRSLDSGVGTTQNPTDILDELPENDILDPDDYPPQRPDQPWDDDGPYWQASTDD